MSDRTREEIDADFRRTTYARADLPAADAPLSLWADACRGQAERATRRAKLYDEYRDATSESADTTMQSALIEAAEAARATAEGASRRAVTFRDMAEDAAGQ